MVKTCSKAEWFGFRMVGPYRDAIYTNGAFIWSDHLKTEQNSSDLEWFGLGMVRQIALTLAMIDHSNAEPF